MIGTIEECRVAREKQIPKKPRKTDSYRGLINKIYAYVRKCMSRKMGEWTSRNNVLLDYNGKIPSFEIKITFGESPFFEIKITFGEGIVVES